MKFGSESRTILCNTQRDFRATGVELSKRLTSKQANKKTKSISWPVIISNLSIHNENHNKKKEENDSNNEYTKRKYILEKLTNKSNPIGKSI